MRNGFIRRLSETTSLEGIKPSMGEKQATTFTHKEEQALKNFRTGAIAGAMSNVFMQAAKAVAMKAIGQTMTGRVVSEAFAQFTTLSTSTAVDHLQNDSGKGNQPYAPKESTFAAASGFVVTGLQILAIRKGANFAGQVVTATLTSGSVKVGEWAVQSATKEESKDISQEFSQDTSTPTQHTFGQKALRGTTTGTFRIATAMLRATSPNSYTLAIVFAWGSGLSKGTNHLANNNDSAQEEVKPKVSHTGPKR